MKKRVLSTLLVIMLCITFLPNIEVSATDQNMNNPKITDYTDNQFFIEKLGVLFDKLVNNQYNYFTTTGKTCGNSKCNICNTSNVTKQHPTISSLNVDYTGDTHSCYGFAKWTFKYLYGKDATGVFDNPSSRGSTNSTIVVASTYDGSSSAKAVIQQAKIGDILQAPNPHSMIFLKCDDKYFYVLHSNWKWSNEGNNIVKVSKFSYDQFNKITVYRADNYSNYDIKAHTCSSYETYKNGNTKILGACKDASCRKPFNWQDTFSRITNQTASLKSSKKNYKVNVYNAPYEDATKTTSKKPVEKFAIVGTVKNAYGNEWYAIDYPDDTKKVCYIAYIYKSTLTDNYEIITSNFENVVKYESSAVINKEHSHNYNYNNGQCYCGAVKATTQQTNAASTLKINLTKYPVQHTQGNNFGLRGTISSNYKIKKIYGYIKQNGNIIQSTEDSPNTKSVDVKEKNLNNNLIFDRLGAGNYTLEVYAVDASGNGLTVTKNFTVVGQTVKAESNLTINLEKYPVTLNAGSSYGLRGSISSNYNIALVRGYVINSSGQTVLSSKDTPNSTSMDIRYANLNDDLVFNNLSAGNYTMKVVATDNSGRTVEVSKAFTVVSNTSSNNSSLSINLEKYPVTLNVGSSYGLRGSVTSNYNISVVRGYVINSSGQTVLSSKDTPNSTYMDIKPAHLNADLVFNKLSTGNYTMKVVAVDTSGRTVEATKNFTVKAKDVYVDNSPNGNGVTGTVVIPSSWDNLSIRSGPSTNYQIVGSMNNGAKCTVYPNKTSNGWYYVNYNGIWGYASGNQINLNSTSSSNTRVGIVNIPSSWTDLSIRTGPSTNYQIVGGMPHGARCTVYPGKASNGWYYVEYNGVSGYAAGNRINLQ